MEFHPRFHAAPPQRPSSGLEREQPRAGSLGADPRTLGGNLLGGRIGQVPHHLPADGRIRIKQPVDDGHKAIPAPVGRW